MNFVVFGDNLILSILAADRKERLSKMRQYLISNKVSYSLMTEVQIKKYLRHFYCRSIKIYIVSTP